MPSHDSGEISEIQSTTTGKGDWETVSNTSTASLALTPTTPSAPTTPASPAKSAFSRSKHQSGLAETVEPEKPKRSRAAGKPKKSDSPTEQLSTLSLSPKEAKQESGRGDKDATEDIGKSKTQGTGKERDKSKPTESQRSRTSKSKSSTTPSHTKEKGKAKGEHEATSGRTTPEEYFHQQSKLFSNVEKRHNAFQQKVKDEKERQRNAKSKGRK